ncbi:MAG: tol-pal system protein YbgF [Steroidobacteraceae bacterium]|jgi:tol-pal system protein YbgF|nr:tol-pal system protein YbgF [Steroidobacteraceae bacterium]
MPHARSRAVPRLLAALSLAAALGGCVATAAEDDPTQVRIEDMDRRLGRVERVAGGQTLLEMSQRIDALQAEARRLRGQVEVLENANEALRKQQRDLYADLSRRLEGLEGGAPRASTGGSPSGGSAAGVAAGEVALAAGGAAAGAGGGAGTAAAAGRGADTPEARYGRAFDALKASNYAAAIAGMREFLAAYPNHELADNAQYWLGEAYYVTRDYDSAIGAFTAVGERWPQSSKAPDAMLKLGYSQFELKRLAAAKQTLSQVGERYPGTDAARLAQERLRRIP